MMGLVEVRARYARSRAALCGLCLAASLSTSACWFRKGPRVFNPPPLPVAPKVELKPVAIIMPDESLIAPVEVAALPETPRIPPLPAPAPAPAPPKRPAVAVAPKPPPVVVTEPTPEPTPVPRLGQIFTAEQTREYNRVYDEALERVRKSVAAMEKKSLTPEQSQTLETIRSFQKQAEQAHEQDLLTAVNLARRADLLAKDLAGRLP